MKGDCAIVPGIKPPVPTVVVSSVFNEDKARAIDPLVLQADRSAGGAFYVEEQFGELFLVCRDGLGGGFFGSSKINLGHFVEKLPWSARWSFRRAIKVQLQLLREKKPCA